MSPKTQRISVRIIRIIVGLVFLLSGVGKLIDSGYVNYDLVRLLSTKFFWIIEYAATIIVSISIFELILALLLLWGKKLSGALSGALAMLIMFSSVLGYFYLQGMTVEGCGCFGAFGIGGGLEFTLIRNAILIIMLVTGLILHNKSTNER